MRHNVGGNGESMLGIMGCAVTLPGMGWCGYPKTVLRRHNVGGNGVNMLGIMGCAVTLPGVGWCGYPKTVLRAQVIVF